LPFNKRRKPEKGLLAINQSRGIPMKDKTQVSESRRGFLCKAGLSGGAVAVAASMPGVVVAAQDAEPQVAPKEEGYRLSQHIIDYYKSAAV
jgi:hypothetical protein